MSNPNDVECRWSRSATVSRMLCLAYDCARHIASMSGHTEPPSIGKDAIIKRDACSSK